LFKTFLFGVILGLAAAAGAAYVLPVSDLHRESSLISVLPNGGNSEVFRIRVPDDRLIGGGVDTPTPASLSWPDSLANGNLQLELFKLRNRDDIVVGVASRLFVAGNGQSPAALEWVLHLPARGTVYFPMSVTADAAGFRTGQLRAGTREFARRTGGLREQYVANPAASGGHIELQSSLLGVLDPLESGGQP
jgi:hypothetical protein